MRDYLTGKEVLQKTIDYCVEQLDMKAPTIDDIGRVCGQQEILTFKGIRTFSHEACHDYGLDSTNYFCHFGTHRHLEDLRSLGYPEFTLEWLVTDANYLDLRKEEMCVIAHEEMLRDGLAGLEEKYSKRKVKALKKRLSIPRVLHDVLADHYARFGTIK